MFENYPDIVSPQMLQEMLGIGKHKVSKLIQSKEVDSFRIGRLIKIPKKAVIRFVEEHCTQLDESEKSPE